MVLSMFLSLVSVCSFSQKVNNADFTYPLKPGDCRWEKMNSVEERIESLQIPQNILSKISTERLLDICLDYPYLLDVLFYDDYQKGIDALKSNFNGFDELLRRRDLGKYVLAKEKKFSLELDKLNDKDDIEKGNFSFQYFVLDLISAQDDVFATLSGDDEDELLDITITNMELKIKHTEVFGNLSGIPSYLLYAKKVLGDPNFKFIDAKQKNDVIDFVNRPSGVDNNIIDLSFASSTC